ncbi:MAG: 50S ribosomal protein L25/general stress protein Ctc [Pseudomonadales bacterium]|nr:50S ribosomal protein L25/general stress protein Ctc [Pseudomonadales bacterium]
MSDAFELEATSRADVGKGASRRLRRLEKKIPAIVYGGGKDPSSITLGHDDLWHHLQNEAFFSHIITLKIDGTAEDVLLKDLQRHPAKDLLMHADFLRVDKNQPIVVNVPLHFTNEEACIGVKVQGGRISHFVNDIEIRCLPKDLPEYIEVDMLKVESGTVLHISDVMLPTGVESVALSHGSEHDLAIANIAQPKGIVDEDAAEGDAADEPKDEDSSES